MYSEKMLEMQMGSKMSMDVINQLAAPEMVEAYLVNSRKDIELIVRRTGGGFSFFKHSSYPSSNPSYPSYPSYPSNYFFFNYFLAIA
jgi:hypothetical protein